MRIFTCYNALVSGFQLLIYSMNRRSLIIATGNSHKVEEFQQLLKDDPFTVLSAKTLDGMPEVDETGGTFAENACLKARALEKLAPPGAWVLADDSGLEVDCLNGEPGVYSARYAGDRASDSENIEKLLKALEGVPFRARSARFKSVLCIIDTRGLLTYHEGNCEGHIATEASGESGFGYDPIFIPEGYRKSFAELGSMIKSQLSHRAKAVKAFCLALNSKS